ncbi:DUF4932 domain-containing protein [Thermococcus sp.]
MKRLAVLVILSLLIVTAVPAGAYRMDSKVSVEINPNSELLGIVYYLAFGPGDPFVIDRGEYSQQVESWFSPYRNATAVAMLRDYLSKGSIPERDYRLMVLEYYLLLCSKPPELKPLIPMNNAWFLRFLKALRDFAGKTDFMDFYRSHESYYMEDLNIYTGALELLPPDRFMAQNAGVSNVTYRFEHPFLLAVHGHSFNLRINGTQIYGAGGMLPLVRRTPQRTFWSYKTARDTIFGLPLNRDIINSTYLNELLYLGFIYHELGHDITSGWIGNSRGLLLNLTYLESTIKENMPYLSTYDMHFWGSAGMIYEGFADAWEDYALARIDPDYVALIMWMQRAWGEFWIDDTLELYEKYSPESIPGIEPIGRFIPKMMQELRKRIPPEKAGELYRKRVPVTPLMAFDRGAVTGRLLVVYGTRNPNPKGTEYDRRTAELIAENLKSFYSQWPGNVSVEVKADINITGAELKENLVLVGGPVANGIVAGMQDEFPLRFVKENGRWVIEHNTDWNVTAFLLTEDLNDPVLKGRLISVSNASLVMAIRNPRNPENFIIWVAGADRYRTRIYTNPTYYLSSYEIFSGKEIEEGFYVQS